ncbi:MAG: 3'-5' exonuclease [Spirochaetia bacterium]|nr:3'-5' exonuclease [Spirochaetia bacterium]
MITCIDFELANPSWESVCSMGVSVIEDGKITFTYNTLIKPHPDYSAFNRDNIRVHGIKPEMVQDAPEFDAVYAVIKPYIEGAVLAAHGGDFDITCLRDMLTIYHLPIPSFEYIDTHLIARATWKELENHKLKTVAEYLGLDHKHHDAGNDAYSSAMIITKSMEIHGTTDIYKLAEMLGINIGRITAGCGYVLSTVKFAARREARKLARQQYIQAQRDKQMERKRQAQDKAGNKGIK